MNIAHYDEQNMEYRFCKPLEGWLATNGWWVSRQDWIKLLDDCSIILSSLDGDGNFHIVVQSITSTADDGFELPDFMDAKKELWTLEKEIEKLKAMPEEKK